MNGSAYYIPGFRRAGGFTAYRTVWYAIPVPYDTIPDTITKRYIQVTLHRLYGTVRYIVFRQQQLETVGVPRQQKPFPHIRLQPLSGFATTLESFQKA